MPLLRFAEALDRWSDAGRVTLTETDTGIAANGLDAYDAIELSALSKSVGWTVDMEDGSGPLASDDQLSAEFAPFRFLMHKPEDIAGPGFRVTNAGFASALRADVIVPVMRLVRSTRPFETASMCVCPFDDERPFEPRQQLPQPRRVVREIDTRRLVPEDIGRWLLRDARRAPWSDPAFLTWAALAAPNLLRSLSNEAERDWLVFRGPPLVRVAIPDDGGLSALGEAGFEATQRAASWVFENERDMEARHALFAAEIARTAAFGRNAGSLVGEFASTALESARIAYGLSLSQVSRDSLKALADLRKAISDETGRLADGTRTVATAVATSLFAGVVLVLARVTTGAPGWVVLGLAFVLALYVAAVIWSGSRFLEIQRDIRAQWRKRLYVFLTDDEYDGMVEGPAERAEGGFVLAARLGATIAAIMLVGMAALVISGLGRATASRDPVAPSAAPMPSKAGSASDPVVRLPADINGETE